MPRNIDLHGLDMAVAAALVAEPGATYPRLSELLGMSPATSHGAVRRLEYAALLRPGTRIVNALALREFLVHGLRYAFAARPGPVVRGVPTAHAGPALRAHVVSDAPYVWPSPEGDAVGPAVSPLYARAAELPRRSPAVYELLSAMDALRVGRARERKAAAAAIDRRLQVA